MTVIIGIVIAFAATTAILYNKLVRLRNQTANAWSQVDVQLSRRHDLIPNLVEAVKGYMRHERALLEELTRARSLAMQASGVAAVADAENKLSCTLGQVMAVIEAYPDLKANQNTLALQEELVSTENKVAFARQFYNDSVMHLNTGVQSFPSNIAASMFGFKEAEFFELDDAGARQPPQINLNPNP